MPAHVTLLYPFAEEAQLDDGGAGPSIAAIVGAASGPATLTLGEGRRFPDTLYASVEPDAPVRALQAELAAAFPTLPLYGGAATSSCPHVSIVEGPAADGSRRRSTTRPGPTLPVEQLVDAIDLITGRDGSLGDAAPVPAREAG